MYKQLITLIALCVLASGNLKANPQPAVQTGTGTLIVFRMWHLAGCGGSLPFWINGKLTGKLKNGCYYKLELPVGDYVLAHKDIVLGLIDKQTVHIKPGETVYFYNQATMVSWIFEVAEDQTEAAQKVSHLRQQN